MDANDALHRRTPPPPAETMPRDPALTRGSVDTSVLDALPFLTWKSDLQGKCDYVNPAWLKFTGRTREQELGDGWALAVHSEDVERVLQTYREAFAARRVFEMEYRLRRHDGEYRWVVHSGAPIVDPDGRFAGYIGGCQDITPRRQAEQATRASEERFQNVFNEAPMAMAIASPDRRFIAVNDTFCQMLGYERAELLDLTYAQITHPDDRAETVDRSAGLLDGTVPSFRLEKRYLHKNGGIVWTQLTTFAVRDAAGATLYSVGFMENITRQKWAAEELQRAHQTLEALIEQSPLAVVFFDVDQRVQRWNPAAERILGWPREDVLGRRLDELPGYFGPESEYIWKNVVAGEEQNGREVVRWRKDGTRIEIALWGSRIRDRQGQVTGVMSIAGDLTENKHLKDQLQRAQKLESVGRLAGGVAHDFNNLLAVISGYSEGLLRRVGADSPLRSHVEEIHRAATRGGALTKQLLAFSRRQAVAPRVVDLNKLVVSVHEMLRRVISERIDIRISGTSTPRWIRADPNQLEQVLVNLALNARDAMESPPAAPAAGSDAPGSAGQLTLETATVALDAGAAAREGVKPGNYVRLAVGDTGHGMTPEIRSRIFEPFFTTKDQHGTGLGLSIVYGVVEQCGGNISVRSDPGHGTHFDILLPASDAPE